MIAFYPDDTSTSGLDTYSCEIAWYRGVPFVTITKRYATGTSSTAWTRGNLDGRYHAAPAVHIPRPPKNHRWFHRFQAPPPHRVARPQCDERIPLPRLHQMHDPREARRHKRKRFIERLLIA